jgi:hypothetical protein
LLGRACLHILAPQTNGGRYEKRANHSVNLNKKEPPN